MSIMYIYTLYIYIYIYIYIHTHTLRRISTITTNCHYTVFHGFYPIFIKTIQTTQNYCNNKIKT